MEGTRLHPLREEDHNSDEENGSHDSSTTSMASMHDVFQADTQNTSLSALSVLSAIKYIPRRGSNASQSTAISTDSDKPPVNNSSIVFGSTAWIQRLYQRRKLLARLRGVGEKIVSSKYFVAMGCIGMLWAVYEHNLMLAFTSKSQSTDMAFQAMLTLTLIVFVLEMALLMAVDRSYFTLPTMDSDSDRRWSPLHWGSFNFYMDLVSAVSIFLDLAVFRASAAHPLLTQACQTLRLARISRLLRLVNKYVNMPRKQARKTTVVRVRRGSTMVMPQGEMTPSMETKVGAALGELTGQRVLVGVLALLLILPLLISGDEGTSYLVATNIVDRLALLNASDPAVYSSGLALAVNLTLTKLPVACLTVEDMHLYCDHSAVASLRPEESLMQVGQVTRAVFDLKSQSMHSAVLGIVLTSAVLIVLTVGCLLFESAVRTLVISPLERIVGLVKAMARNPLEAVDSLDLSNDDLSLYPDNETTRLLLTIARLGALLKVGFGQAGALVLSKCLSSDGRLDVSLCVGTQVKALFGFVDIRSFTDTTECLQTDVMGFVNRIAYLLHNIVEDSGGAANKNIGDAFLLVWRLDAADGANNSNNAMETSMLADRALLCFLRMFIELSRHQHSFVQHFSVSATQRLYQRFPNYSVRLGCGLHCGVATEGAMGSAHKLDASYLGPDVLFAETLESLTKRYYVPLLLSEPLYRLLSPAAAQHCRQVDAIARGHSRCRLYTYDADLDIDFSDPYRPTKGFQANRRATDNPGNTPNANMGGSQKTRRNAVITSNSRKRKQAVILPHHPASTSPKAAALPNTMGLPLPLPLSMNAMPAMLRRQPSRLASNASAATVSDLEAALAETLRRHQLPAHAAAFALPTLTHKEYHVKLWTSDPELRELRHRSDPANRLSWAEAMQAYEEGSWLHCRSVLVDLAKTSRDMRGDGPLNQLLAYMKERDFVTPTHWKGYRTDDE